MSFSFSSSQLTSLLIVCSKVPIEHGESFETPANNTESTDLVTSAAERRNDLHATLDKLDIDPKINENNQER